MQTHRYHPVGAGALCVGLVAAGVLGAAGFQSQRIPAPVALPVRAVPADAAEVKERVKSTVAQLPISFEATGGSSPGAVKYMARGGGFALGLTADGAVFSLRKPVKSNDASPAAAPPPAESVTVGVKFAGGTPGRKLTPLEKMPGVSNYFIGSDPAAWRTGVSHYAKVRCEQVYPGIDLVYYGNQQELEYDFVVAPGADPSRIALSYSGVDKVAVDGSGDLVVTAGDVAMRMERPVTYQEIGSKRVEVASAYEVSRAGEVSFEFGAYDQAHPLIIDPKLKYATYLGGTQSDLAFRVAVDSSGNAYVLGETNSNPFLSPAPAGYDTTYGGTQDTFLTKLDPTGSAVIYSTYIGGSAQEQARAVTVDADNNVYIGGYTQSFANFPLTAGVVRGRTPPSGQTFGLSEGFLCKLASDGMALTWSTFLGGSGEDSTLGVAVDADGNVFAAGTARANFPTTVGAAQTAFGGVRDGFVVKLNSTATSYIYSTYIGGASGDQCIDLAIDGAGCAYIAGDTGGQAVNPGGSGAQALVVKLNSDGSARVYTMVLAGTAEDVAMDLDVDAGGYAYVTGWTQSINFPLKEPYDSTHNGGGTDAFLAVIDASVTGTIINTSSTSTGLLFCTYFGGSNAEIGRALDVDLDGNIFFAGHTNSPSLPTTDGTGGTLAAINASYNGAEDIYVAKFSPFSTPGPATPYSLSFSTFIGAAGNDRAQALVVNDSGIVWLAGWTEATTFPTSPAAYDSTLGGIRDAVALRLQLLPNVAPTILCPSSICVDPSTVSTQTVGWADANGDAVTITWTVNGSLVRTQAIAASAIEPASGIDSLTYTYPAGINTVVVAVDDGEAAPVNCSFTVTGDNIGPEISVTLDGDAVADTITLPNDPGECFATLTGLAATANDVCDGPHPVTLTVDGSPSLDPNGTYDIGTYTVAWSSTDGRGNTATVFTTLEVVDVEAPVLVCPPSVTVNVDSEEDYATLDATELGIGLASATDNCPPAILVAFRNTSGLADTGDPADLAGIYGAGTHTITWIAMDAFLNFTICDQRVTVLDGSEVTSEFESSDEGWTVDSPASLSRLTADGDPGAHLRAFSIAGTNVYFNAPAAYHGNHLSKYGKLLEFTLKQDGDGGDLVSDVDVILSDGTTTLELALTAPDTVLWTRYQALLTETGGWVKSGGETPTQAEVETVLSNVTSLKIRARWSAGLSVTDLDSVFFGAYYSSP